AGTELVDQSGQTLTGIVEGIKKVADIVAEINAASQEQSAGIDQVNNAVAQMDDMTQQNAALVEESAAASRSMEDQTGILVDAVSFFKLGDNRGSYTQHQQRHMPSGDRASPAVHELPARQVSGGDHYVYQGVPANPLKARTDKHLQKLRNEKEKAEGAARKTGTTDRKNEWEDF
ncbi:MAG: methyl-accepting chemotaxis protein, partial [Gammaproteobacteria bacterium]|nr:methyl-accepting chemotaxis protein [Gammaproteobacteria bacterium]